MVVVTLDLTITHTLPLSQALFLMLGLKLTLNSGREVYLHNAGFGLAYKLAKLYAVLSSIYDLAGQLSDEVIENSEIHINNFIGTNYSEKDCYFYLMFNGEKVTI